MLKYASLKYENSSNLGDNIQSLAAEQYLPRIDWKFNRDTLAEVESNDEYLMIMNGWFSHYPERCFPSSEAIKPVFFGFHITNWNDTANYFFRPEVVEYFKRNEPIGCRDEKTAELLCAKGVKAFQSMCLTLTFPKRKVAPRNGQVFLVDALGIPVPNDLYNQAQEITHAVDDFYGDEIKTKMAEKLLALYRDEAKLVITTRLHCALPCIAMGIPVLYFGKNDDPRTSLLKRLNLEVHKMPNKWLGLVYRCFRRKSRIGSLLRSALVPMLHRKVKWDPEPIDVEVKQAEMRRIVKDMVDQKLSDAN